MAKILDHKLLKELLLSLFSEQSASTLLQVSASIVGRGCRIGKGAQIQGSYLHDNVTVWEGAHVDATILCEGVTVMPGACVREGSIISFKVVDNFNMHYFVCMSAFVMTCLCAKILVPVYNMPRILDWQAVVGRGQTIGGHKRISLCQHVANVSDSEDEREIPSREVSAFGSAESEGNDFGEQPSAACISDAAAAAAGNSFSGAVPSLVMSRQAQQRTKIEAVLNGHHVQSS